MAQEKIPVYIEDEMKKSYMSYAMSVIIGRALPDVRDGLKPVHRRILFAMHEMGVEWNKPYKKSARVVGDVIGKYHPHGDTAVYDAITRMVQDFSLRYPLIDGQGNFGSVDGDAPAAMRYTEVRMARLTGGLLSDIDKETVDWRPNYDESLKEPLVMPAAFPNLLVNGSSGIAVGMATNMPPHNLSEVIDGIVHIINKPDATIKELMKLIPGPDFPTAGFIHCKEGIKAAYETGRGIIQMRARATTEKNPRTNRQAIVITEIPYQVNKEKLIKQIAELVNDKKIEGISHIRDESDREGMRIFVELKRDEVAEVILNNLFLHTQMQTTFGIINLAIVDGQPRVLNLKQLLELFVRFRKEVVTRRTIFELKKAREREHILLGLKIALDNLDAVITLIRASKDADTAKIGLIEKFGLTEIQAQAILDMQLRKLAALERQKIEDELKQIQITIKDYESILISPQKIIEMVKAELNEIKEKYYDERKTKVVKSRVGELTEEDLVVNEKCIITISDNGYIKRLKDDTYKKQGRGGKGVTGATLREEDQISTIKICETHDYTFFFTNTGKVYKLRVWDIPESSRMAKGTALVNFLSISQSEKIQAFLSISAEKLDEGKGFIAFVTEKGQVKKTPLSEFANIRSSGILAIKLASDDYLTWVGITSGSDELLLTTSLGQSIKFNEKDVRGMGRAAAGVTGIKLSKADDYVVGTVIIPNKSTDVALMVITSKGYGKNTPVNEYKVQNRGGSGILTYKVSDKTGKLVTAKEQIKGMEGDLLVATVSGKVIRLPGEQVPTLGRATIGVRLIRLDTGDHVTSVAVLEKGIENGNGEPEE